MRYACGLRKPSRARRRCAVRACQAEQSREAKALLRHTPHEINVASCTLYQAEGRVLLRWEASKQNPSAASAILRLPSLVQREVALCLIRRAPLAICARSELRTIYIDCQTHCAPFLASAARHNQKTKHPAKSIPSKTPRAKPCELHIPQRRNSRAAATNSPPRWPTLTNHRSRRPRRPKKKPRPRRRP